MILSEWCFLKKIITVLLSAVLALTLFCGCAGGDGTDALRKALEYPLTLDAESGELAFVLTLETNENATAKMTAPRTLSGLDLVKNKNGVTASYKGMTVPLPEASAGKVFALADIVNAVRTALDDGTYVTGRDGDLKTVSAACGDAVCTLYYIDEAHFSSAEISCGGKKTVYNITVRQAEEQSSAVSAEQSNQSKETVQDAEKSG